MELKHYVGIFSVAADHYAAEINRLESDIVRHNHFIKELIGVPRASRNRDRLHEIGRLTELLKEYREILAFCVKMREDLADVNAEQLAKKMGVV